MSENSREIDMRLEAILDYEMDELEAKAYKLCLIWLDKSRTMFPDYNHNKMLSKGDPRKSQIFKYCYKLVRETQNDILKEEDYPLYVRAQLEILKYLTKDKKTPLITPQCLAGEKAWIRWKLWKKKYDDRSKVINQENSAPIPTQQVKVVEALNRTKEFLSKTLGDINKDKICEAVSNGSFLRWLNLNKISPYYLALSKWVDVSALKLNFDLAIYKDAISKEGEAHFKSLFPLES